LSVVYRPLSAAPLFVCCMYLAVCMLKASRDTLAAGEEELVSCDAKQGIYFLICTVLFNPCGDFPLAS
jgi:hypothetical protein